MSKKSFGEHRRNARARNIPFLFTYEEWERWWLDALGPEWRSKRGRKKGMFCMARLNDAGPYAPGNVRCITQGDNCSDAAFNDAVAFGEAAGHAVLTEEIVAEIYVSECQIKYLADKYGVSPGTVNDIRSGRTWGRVTVCLFRNSMRGRNQWK